MPFNNAKAIEILEGLRYLADRARAADVPELGADIDRLVADHTGESTDTGTDVTDVVTGSGATDPVVVVDLDETIDDAPAVTDAVLPPAVADVDAEDYDDGDEDDYDELEEREYLAGLAGAVDEVGMDVMRQVTPRTLTLIAHADGGVSVEEARMVASLVTPSIADVVAPDEDRNTALTVGEPEVTDEATTVTLTLSEDNTGTVLAAMGAERNVFEATLEVAGKTITVTSLTGAPADLDLAREMGWAPAAREDDDEGEALPEVPEGQHPINGVLTRFEEVAGVRPRADAVHITYRKDDGSELTVDQVATIVRHPISAGLARMGLHPDLAEVVDGHEPATKVARFAALGGGDLDPAVLAFAARYRGTFDFGGAIGSVTANAETVLAAAEVDIDA